MTPLFAVQTPQQRVGKLGTGVSHGKPSASCAILCLDNLIITELDSTHQLGQQRHDRYIAASRVELEMMRMWDLAGHGQQLLRGSERWMH